MHVLTTGEEVEFTALVHRQSRFVFRVAYAVLLNSHDAEDAVQEMFLKLYRNGGWQHMDSERAFLARVAWRAAIDKCRQQPQTAVASLDDSTGEGPAADPPSHAPGPEQSLLLAGQHALVHSMIDALPEELRVPLALSAFDELNSREIGGILEIPEGTVRTRLHRARLLLRQKIGSLKQTRIQETPHA
jgi:RNA polymerase sigma-70 factor (ECF subfamily)